MNEARRLRIRSAISLLLKNSFADVDYDNI